MLDRSPAARLPRRAPRLHKKFVTALWLVLMITAAGGAPAYAQSLQREFDTPIKAAVDITNRNGRVMVIASDEQQQRMRPFKGLLRTF